MQLTSPDISQDKAVPQAHVFDGFGCSGGNLAPLLSWSDAPPETKSFALTLYDPDAPTGSGWWHWVAYNLPARSQNNQAVQRSANQPQLDGGIRQALNDFGTYNYGGPCPPEGSPPHRYVFTVHALKVPSIELPEGASAATVRFMIHANTLASAAITARHGR
ncbi:MAG: YbhB/YbcL family Raf kinase inhibitor-like protein [Ramlibacter sp.]|nr:YbhB/YbcL family Raf kinase inhibitor-like protein [Ramlibacter sp.]